MVTKTDWTAVEKAFAAVDAKRRFEQTADQERRLADYERYVEPIKMGRKEALAVAIEELRHWLVWPPTNLKAAKLLEELLNELEA